VALWPAAARRSHKDSHNAAGDQAPYNRDTNCRRTRELPECDIRDPAYSGANDPDKDRRPATTIAHRSDVPGVM
jgi:hypothetical protein